MRLCYSTITSIGLSKNNAHAVDIFTNPYTITLPSVLMTLKYTNWIRMTYFVICDAWLTVSRGLWYIRWYIAGSKYENSAQRGFRRFFLLSTFGQHKYLFAITAYYFLIITGQLFKELENKLSGKPYNILLGLIGFWFLYQLIVLHVMILPIFWGFFSLALGHLLFRASASEHILTDMGKISWYFGMNQGTFSI